MLPRKQSHLLVLNTLLLPTQQLLHARKILSAKQVRPAQKSPAKLALLIILIKLVLSQMMPQKVVLLPQSEESLLLLSTTNTIALNQLIVLHGTDLMHAACQHQPRSKPLLHLLMEKLQLSMVMIQQSLIHSIAIANH